MRYDPRDPQNPDNDRFVLSKGHAAPILYAAWAEAGIITREDLLTLRTLRLRSRRASDAAAAVRWTSPPARSARASAPASASRSTRGASAPTTAPTCCSATARRRKARSGKRRDGRVPRRSTRSAASPTSTRSARAGRRSWQHDMDALRRALARLRLARHRRRRPRPGRDPRRARRGARTKGRPTMILARTLKGKGVSFMEGKGGWHGKPLKKGEEVDKALAELKSQFVPEDGPAPQPQAADRCAPRREGSRRRSDRPPTSWATRWRRARPTAPRSPASAPPTIASSRSTPTSRTRRSASKFEQQHPERFYQNFIAEQVMIGAAMGLAARGAIPFPVDVRRVPDARLRLHPHGGDQQPEHQDGRLARRRVDRRGRPVADGARGSRDDARAAEHHRALSVRRRQHRAADRARWPITAGPVYMRTSRPKTPVIYGPDETFAIGGLKVLRRAPPTWRRSIGAGVTVFEALKATTQLKKQGVSIRVIDLLFAAADRRGDARRAARARRRAASSPSRITTPAGGIGDAVASAVAAEGFTVRRLAVPRDPAQRHARGAARPLRHLGAPHRRRGERTAGGRGDVLTAAEARLSRR